MAGAIVYVHTAPNGKRYVGQTSRGDSRWHDHVRQASLGSDTAFHRAIRKYGADAFTREVLERMTTEAGAKRAEQLWIARLETRVPQGYNLTDGGDGRTGKGRVFSQAHREALARAHVGKTDSAETRLRKSAAQRRAHAEGRRTTHIGDWCRGRPRKHSDETRAKMSATHRAKRAH
jgi:group I intron endonuclease